MSVEERARLEDYFRRVDEIQARLQGDKPTDSKLRLTRGRSIVGWSVMRWAYRYRWFAFRSSPVPVSSAQPVRRAMAPSFKPLKRMNCY